MSCARLVPSYNRFASFKPYMVDGATQDDQQQEQPGQVGTQRKRNRNDENKGPSAFLIPRTTRSCCMTDKQAITASLRILPHTSSHAAASSLSPQSSRLELRSSFLWTCREADLGRCLHQLARLLRAIVIGCTFWAISSFHLFFVSSETCRNACKR